MSPRKKLGDWGEKLALDYFSSLGYTVRKGKPRVESDIVTVDSVGEIRNIEVKTSQRGVDKKWRATLIKKGHTDHRKSDLVLMLCVNNGVVTLFIIPTKDIQDHKHLCISSNPLSYAGKFAQYRVGVKVCD